MKGIIAAVPTPIDFNSRPIKSLFLEHCGWALANGCDGLNVLGSTGEANSFASDTRREIMGWASEAFDLNRLMVGTGTPALAETLSLTIHADDLGYPVALVLPPYYYTPPSDNGLIAWYLSLHEALGDRPIKVWFYNFPQMTGFVIPERVIEFLHREAPDRFEGIKDSSGDLDCCRRLVGAMPNLQIFPSSETSLAEGRSQGFAGCISATVNHSAALCQKVWQGDVSPVDEIAKLRSAISQGPLIPSVKYMVAKRTGQTEWTNVLPPFTGLSAAQMAALDLLA